MSHIESHILSTPRLRLRPLQPSDAAVLVFMYSDREFMRYWAFAPLTETQEALERVLRKIKNVESGTRVCFAIDLAASGETLGTCDLFGIDKASGRAEIGYGLLPKHWGQGYLRDAISVVLEYAFDRLSLRRIEADVDPGNVRSLLALERAGFVREGLLRARWQVDGGCCPTVPSTAFYTMIGFPIGDSAEGTSRDSACARRPRQLHRSSLIKHGAARYTENDIAIRFFSIRRVLM